MLIDLTKLKEGKSGIINEIEGTQVFKDRLEKMGVRKGKKIKKISSHFWKGPQTVGIGSSRFAIGFGMAKKILIEVDK